jgi:hypothetical protein
VAKEALVQFPNQHKADQHPGPGQPTHSRAGNPFPARLTPVIVPVEDALPWPASEEDVPRPDYSGLVTTDDYIYEELEPGEELLRFKLHLVPRRERETDEQYEAYRRGVERSTRIYGFYHGCCRQLCTWLGNHETCREGVCRRNGACRSRRDEDRFTLPILIYPPCVPIDIEIMEAYRAEIVAELRRFRAEMAARVENVER